jgi:hypothetical protein
MQKVIHLRINKKEMQHLIKTKSIVRNIIST